MGPSLQTSCHRGAGQGGGLPPSEPADEPRAVASLSQVQLCHLHHRVCPTWARRWQLVVPSSSAHSVLPDALPVLCSKPSESPPGICREGPGVKEGAFGNPLGGGRGRRMQVLAPGEILVGREGGWEGVGWGEAGASEVKMGGTEECVCIWSPFFHFFYQGKIHI